LPKRESVDFPVVALGASAGGLDAFKRFFDALPANSGMAYVLIQHLDPTHESLMVDLLSGHTVKACGARPEQLACDRVYLFPPAPIWQSRGGAHTYQTVKAAHACLQLSASLAPDCGDAPSVDVPAPARAAPRLKAVKEKGGRRVRTGGAFDGMPRSAIMSGGADLVLTVAKIPQALARYGRQTYVKPGRADVRPCDDVQDGFAGIIDFLAARTPHDFSLYKQGTLQRRIERRMAMAGIESGAGYLQVLREDPGERDLLAKDLLINVTQFFRDPVAFDLLGEQIIPDLVQRQTLDRPLRIWVPGCSTGEEAYSITMLFLEQIATARRNIKLQVFASDIDADCVALPATASVPKQSRPM
jgi:two-component system CheB/CheR fusion protein